MNSSRRLFLGSSMAGLAALPLVGQEPKKIVEEKEIPSGKVVREDAPFQPSTLFLTWHTDPTTTMDIQWIGTMGETSDVKVYYSSDKVLPSFRTEARPLVGPVFPKPEWQVSETVTRPYPMTDFKVFRSLLTGLKPGTEYSFRIGRSSPVYKFATMPAKATNAIQFVSGGDCGINAAAVANNIQAARQNPSFAVVGGDLGYDNGRSVEVSMAFIRNYSKTMVTRDGRMIPMLACIGNHEVDGAYGKTRDKGTFFYPLFEGLYPDTGYATLDFGDYLSLVMLDTGHTSPISGDQAGWLEKVLKERESHPNVFAVNHVPCYPSFRNPVAAVGSKDPDAGTGGLQRKHWVPLFEKYRLPVVLEHHDHTFKRTKPLIGGMADSNGVMYLGDGSWGRIRNPKKADPLSVMARISEDFHLTLHRIQGEERFHLALDEQGMVMDVSRTGQRSTNQVRARS
jgi:acid phosphatase type 7